MKGFNMSSNIDQNVKKHLGGLLWNLSQDAPTKHTDKLFGTLLSPGDVVELRFLFYDEVITQRVEIHSYNGIEYRTKNNSGDANSDDSNIGHSGFKILNDKNFVPVINGTPYVLVTKV